MGWQSKTEAGEVVLIDGGTGSELQRRGVPTSDATWGGTALHTHPDVVRDVHRSFIEAGAEVIIANTFGTARFQLEAAGLGDEFESLNRLAVELAREARDASGNAVEIAGSMSNLPPNFDVADYPDAHRELDDLRALAELLADQEVDLIALEMMQDTHHAPLAMEAALETGLPVWLGLSCRCSSEGDGLVSFDLVDVDFADPLDALIEMGPSAVNLMHCEVASVLPAIEMVRRRWSGPIGVYPEVGYFTYPNWHFDEDSTPERYAAHAQRWVDAGALIVGGCCGTGPEHIAALRGAGLGGWPWPAA